MVDLVKSWRMRYHSDLLKSSSFIIDRLLTQRNTVTLPPTPDPCTRFPIYLILFCFIYIKIVFNWKCTIIIERIAKMLAAVFWW